MRTVPLQRVLVFTAVVGLLSGCFVKEAGDRSPKAQARSDARRAPGVPKDVLRVPPMAQAFPGAGGDLQHVWYLPYAVIDEVQGLALVEKLIALTQDHQSFPETLDVGPGRGASGSNVLHSVRPGVGRLYYSDINDPRGPAATGSEIPVIISQPEPGAPDADVLYLDGHKERVPIGVFPLSRALLDALGLLDPPND